MGEDQTIDSPIDKGDPLSIDIVTGECSANSRAGQKRQETHRLALRAREKDDAVVMFKAYRIAVEQRAEMEGVWLRALEAMGGIAPAPAAATVGPAEAIRDVALAAIKLATDVALKGGERNDHGDGN